MDGNRIIKPILWKIWFSSGNVSVPVKDDSDKEGVFHILWKDLKIADTESFYEYMHTQTV
jgi:hypothetical protein